MSYFRFLLDIQHTVNDAQRRRDTKNSASSARLFHKPEGKGVEISPAAGSRATQGIRENSA